MLELVARFVPYGERETMHPGRHLLSIVLLLWFFGTHILASTLYFEDKSWLTAKIVKRTEKKLLVAVDSMELYINHKRIARIQKQNPIAKTSISEKHKKKIAATIMAKISARSKISRLNAIGIKILPYLEFLVERRLTKEQQRLAAVQAAGEKPVYDKKYRQRLRRNKEKRLRFYQLVCHVLYRWQSPATLPLLARLASYPNRRVSHLAIDVLGKQPTLASIYLLIELAKTSEHARKILLQLNDPYTSLSTSFSIATILMESLAKRPLSRYDCNLILLLGKLKSPESVLFLERASHHRSSVIAMTAMDALAFNGDYQALEFLLMRMENDPLPVYRRKAVYALGKSADIELIPRLLPILKSKDQRFVKSAHWALQKLSGKDFSASFRKWQWWWRYEEQIWPEVKVLLGDLEILAADLSQMEFRNPQRQNIERKITAILDRFEELRDPRTIPSILELLKNGPTKIRQAACRCLGRIKHPRVVPDIITYMRERGGTEPSTAHQVLKRMTGWKLPLKPDLWQKWWEAQPENNNGLHDKLLQLANDDTIELQHMAIALLGDLGNKKILPSLRSMLDSQKDIAAKTQISAIHVLRKFQDQDSIQPLIQLMRSDNQKIKRAAHTALLSITGEDLRSRYDDWNNWWLSKYGAPKQDAMYYEEDNYSDYAYEDYEEYEEYQE